MVIADFNVVTVLLINNSTALLPGACASPLLPSLLRQILMHEASSELSRPVVQVSPAVLAGALNKAVLQSEPSADPALLDHLKVQLLPTE